MYIAYIIIGILLVETKQVIGNLFFDPSLLPITIVEELPLGSFVTKVSTDPKGATFVITGNGGTYFSIDNTTGNITIKQRIDREALSESSISVTITASKDGDTITGTLTCIIRDINDNTPSYSQRRYEVSTSESSSVGTVIFSEKAIDKDSGTNKNLRYTIAGGNENGVFSVDGAEKVAVASPLDYENIKKYTLNITVRDIPGLSNWTILVINVADADDLPSKFTSYSYSASVREDSSVGTQIIQVKAFDLDLGINGTVSYKIDQDSNPSRLFAIDNATGVIALNGSLDRETKDEYSIRVLASSSFPVSDHATVIIKIIDVNDNKPVFTQDTYIATVYENMSPGTVVVQIHATDKDQEFNAKMKYSIVASNDSSLFNIDDQSGKISTVVPLDREEKDSYILTVIAEDVNGNKTIGSVFNDSAKVFIIVKDTNDNAPVFSNSTYSIVINESLPMFSSVLQVEAIDPDIDQNIIYTISGGNELSRFMIDRDNGMISIKTLVNRDSPDYQTLFYLQVTATDEKNSSLKSTTNVTITIDDINDNKPACTEDHYTFNVQENATFGTIVGTLSCSDIDFGENGQISFHVISGDDGKFTINGTEGAIETSSDLDYENKTSYNLKIEVRDHGSPHLMREIIVDIKVANINDNIPQFSRQQYQFSILEGDFTENEVLIGAITATDNDKDISGCPCGEIRYSIINTTAPGVFEIDPLTGYLSSAHAFDRETLSNYTLTVMATDLDNESPKFNVTDVIIHVIDVNDNSPIFRQDKYNVNISEARTQGYDVIKVYATDADIGRNANITYTILFGNTGNAFSIDKQTGQIKVDGELDRETLSIYNLLIAGTDDGIYQRRTTVVVFIYITDADDHDPVCTQNNVVVNIKENLAPGQIVTKVSITDKDKDIKEKAVFHLQSDSFAVDPDTGIVNTTRSLDRETNPEHVLIIEASYVNQSSITVNCSVRVFVEDDNDNSPVFGISSHTLSIMENATIGTILMNITATDNDISYNSDVRYSFIGDGTTFAINTNTGILTLIASLDREKKSQYTIHIFATDRGIPQYRSSNITLTINVTDVNDNRPVFIDKIYNANVNENENNTKVIVVEAKDNDESYNGDIIYTITAGNTDDAFTISANGTIITVTTLDRELKDRYELMIMASDRGVPALSSTVQVIITVSDKNDNPPNITNAPEKITIPENLPIGSPVFTLISDDKDEGINARVKYIGYALPDGKFSLDESIGVIKVIGELDREKTQSYKFYVVASDKGIPSLNSSLVEFDIMISDVNDNNPVFYPVSYTANVSEGLASGTQVANVNATEKDDNDRGKITYWIYFGDTDWFFNIDNTTGDITTHKELDRELISQYNLVVAATDHHDPPRIGFGYVTVHVIDTNDLTPVFSISDYLTSVKEDVEIGTEITRVTATDGDMGTNAKISYSILGGDGLNDFNITTLYFNHPKKFIGRIETAKKLDRESRDSYNLTVVASDGKHYATSYVIIKIEDVNDNTPAFNTTGQPLNITISENTPGGYQVTKVNAYDKDDGTNAKITYSIQGDDGKFYIDSNNGILFTSSQSLDKETKDFYNLTVTATDPMNNKAFLIITVHVLDANDNIPKFNQSTYTVDVGEDYVTYDVTATDEDQGLNKKITYRIVYGNDDGLFHIDANTGNVTSTRKLDREGNGLKLDQSGQGIYLLIIEAADQGQPKLSSTTKVIIRVTDINDNTPVFQKLGYQFIVAENESVGYVFGTVVAHDKDLGVNAQIKYSITPAGLDLPFQLNSSSGVLSLNSSLDRENVPVYQITVKAHNQGSLSNVPVTIIVNDVNDNKPVFNQSEYHVSLAENTPGCHVIIDLHADDPDEGTNAEIRYAMVDGLLEKFSVSELSGIVRTVGSLDFEKNRSFTINVSATDQGHPPLQGFVQVIITVTDYNDNAPVFYENNTDVNVSEDIPINSTVTVVRATDIDTGENGKITYSLDTDGHGVFGINPETGEIINLKQLDYEDITTFNLQVKATDRGPNRLYSTTKVTISVVDVNDNAPHFSQSFYFQVDEDALIGRMIGPITANDRDNGNNGRLEYTLHNMKDIFSINQENGMLSLIKTVSKLTNQNISLLITCQDAGNPPLKSNTTAFVYITTGSKFKTQLVPRNINVSIYENSSVGYLVDRLNASTQNDVIYTLLDEQYPIFQLNTSTGEITLIGKLDREKTHQYKLFVAVRDISERLNSDYGIITITVLDINDNSPTFIQEPSILPVPEDSPNGTVVTRVQATDLDEGINQQIFYYIEGAASHTFSINKDTGIIMTISSLDYENHSSYNITVIAENTLSSVRLRSSMSFSIPIKDVLDFMPVFSKQIYNTSVTEDIALGSEVIDLNSTTHDEHSRYIVYRIRHAHSSNNSYHFSIDPETGVIRTQTNLDREITSRYTLDVEARDIRDPLLYKSTTRVVITVDDVNDNIPYFPVASYNFSPRESLNVGDVIGQIQAEDKDEGENAGIVYDIIAGNEQGYCRINSSRGDIYLLKLFDYEILSTITLTVRASDKQKNRRTRREAIANTYQDVKVSISVQDVNDNAPFFTELLVVGKFYPEDPVNTIVATVKAIDKDTGANSIVRYLVLSQSKAGTLILNSQSGQLTRVQSLTNVSVDAYSMEVTARDNDGQVPYNNALNKTTVLVFYLTPGKSLTLIVGIPLPFVKQNSDLLVSILKNTTGKFIILKNLQESPDDKSSTLAHIHIVDIPSRTIITKDDANSIFTRISKDLDDQYPEWKIQFHTSSSPDAFSRTSYFSAYIGAMIVFSVLIGIVGFCAILVVCRYKYREKYTNLIGPEEKESDIVSEIPWTRLTTSYKKQKYQPNSKIIKGGSESVDSSLATNDTSQDINNQTITSILSTRHDDTTPDIRQSLPTTLITDSYNARDNQGFDCQGSMDNGTNINNTDNRESSDTSPGGLGGISGQELMGINPNEDSSKSTDEDNTLEGFQRRNARNFNPFNKNTFKPRDKPNDSIEKEDISLPWKQLSPKSYTPRNYQPNESLGHNVYRNHKAFKKEDSSEKTRPKVRFDLEPSTSGDELEWERHVSNTMPDILNSTNTILDISMPESKNESKTDDSPASSVSDGEKCEVWDLEDDHGFVPYHDDDISPSIRPLDTDCKIEVTSL